MEPNIEKAIQEAERIRNDYNPDNISPFPYQNIQSQVSDLKVFFSPIEGDNLSGAITYEDESKIYTIIVNTKKPTTRQHFTIAHELGHYYLHKNKLSSDEWIIDDDNSLDGAKTLFRLDNGERNVIEKEANNFAAALIMPEELVGDAWKKIKNIEECAKIFNVSILAMTIRLEKLGLIKE